jgi:hypothetical protein
VRQATLLCLMLLALLAPGSAGAEPVIQGLSADRMCDLAIRSAENWIGTPPRLLAAIGKVESGRRDPVSGAVHPWPWTVDADGHGFYYSTKAEAVAAVQAMQSQGARSIDIGCMQVNLLHHPDAFASLELGFDPQVNALYAARFLHALFNRTHDWRDAAGLYHSATPDLGAAYRRMVMAIWLDRGETLGDTTRSVVAEAWAATLVNGSVGLWHGMDPRSSNPARSSTGSTRPRGPVVVGRPLEPPSRCQPSSMALAAARQHPCGRAKIALAQQ